MGNWDVIAVSILCGVIGGVLGTIIFLFPYLKSKGINIKPVLADIKKLVNTSGKLIDAASIVLPSNKTLSTVKIIEEWAKIAVGDAEQRYHAGDICKEERNKVAENVVYSVLKEMNIEVDDNKKNIINAAIQNAVNDLGHSK